MPLEPPRAYFACVIITAFLATGTVIAAGDPIQTPWLVVLLAILLAIGDIRVVYLPRGEAASFGGLFGLTGVWLLPAGGAALVAWIGGLLTALWRRSWRLGRWFNIGQTVLAALSASYVFQVSQALPVIPVVSVPLSILLGGLTYATVNLGLVGMAFALHNGESARKRLVALFCSHCWRYLMLLIGSVGLVAAFHRVGPQALVLALVLIVGLDLGNRAIGCREFHQVTRQVLALIPRRAWEQRHAQRLLHYAVGFGNHLGLSEQDVHDLCYAALLHGAGLSHANDSPLTPEDLGKLGLRLDETADRIDNAFALRRVARIVRHHRERWDGTGFPARLRGAEIPLGARILAILEAFDLMTARRAGRPPVGLRASLETIRQEAGRQFDPQLAEEFVSFVLQNEEWVRSVMTKVSREVWRDQSRRVVESLRERLAGTGRPPWATGESRPPAPADADEPGVEVLLDLISVLSEPLDARGVGERAVAFAGRLLGTRAWLEVGDRWAASEVTAWDPETGSVSCLPGVEPRGPSLAALTSPRPVQMEVDAAGDGWNHLLGPGRWVIASAPLRCRRRVIGTLNVARPSPGRWSPRHMALLELIAGMTALALDNARLNREMRSRLSQVSSLKWFTDRSLDRLPVAVVVFGADGSVWLINQRARALLREMGLDPERLERLHLRGWIRLDRRCEAVRRALIAREERNDRDFEVLLDGQRRILDVHVAPVIGQNGDVVAAVAIAHDVTQTRYLERQVREAERMAAVAQLAAGAAHEIRNPLTSIKVFIQLVRHRLPDGVISSEHFDVVLSEIDRIERLLGDLLLMSRAERLEREPCDLNGLISRVLLLIETQAQERGVTIEVDLHPELPEIQADSRQLRQVVLNLAINAIEAMPGGGVLRLETSVEPDRRRVALRVIDTGTGIDPKHRERVLEPFFTTKPEGTGLGLTVARSIVGNHGGTIEVESEVGRGTIFTVRLPVDGVPLWQGGNPR